MRLFQVIQKFRCLESRAAARPAPAQVLNLNGHHALGVRVRERVQQDVLDDAENGGCRADAQRQRQHRQRGEAGLVAQAAEAVAEVLPNPIHTGYRRGIRRFVPGISLRYTGNSHKSCCHATLPGLRPGRGERPRHPGNPLRRTARARGTAPLPQHAGARSRRALLGHAAAVARDPAGPGGGGARARLDWTGIGVDTWGVDFGLLGARRRAAGQPRATTATPAPTACWRRPSPACRASEIFAQTGIQFMQFNTLFQLYAMKLAGLAGAGRGRHAADDAGPVQLLAHRRGKARVHQRHHHPVLQPAHAAAGRTELLEQLGLPAGILRRDRARRHGARPAAAGTCGRAAEPAPAGLSPRPATTPAAPSPPSRPTATTGATSAPAPGR